MKANTFTAVIGIICLVPLCAFGQSTSGTYNSLLVTGTATVSELTVASIPDFQSNALYFGTSGTQSALSLIYNDGTVPSFTLTATRPSSWNWQRMVSGAAVNAMQLDAANRLILTGTDSVNPPQIVIDPANGVMINGNSLLTQIAADSQYLSAAALSAPTGSLGIGISSSPTDKLVVAGNLNIVSGSSSALFASASNGNVGIGTSSPSAKLDVNGNLNAGDRVNLGFSAPGTTFHCGNLGAMLRPSSGDRAILELHSPSNNAKGVIQAVDNHGLFIQSLTSQPTIFDQNYGGSYVQIAGSSVNKGLRFSSVCAGSNDVGLGRASAGVLQVTDGNTGQGTLIAGTIGIGTNSPSTALDVKGDISASGMLIEKKAVFSPASVGWYRIHAGGWFSAGTVKIICNYNNRVSDIELQYSIWGYGIGGSIQQTRGTRYTYVDQARISSDGSDTVYLDIHVSSAASNGELITIYGYGPQLGGLVANPGIVADAGSSSVKVLPLSMGFGTTDTITASGTLALSGSGALTLPDGTVIASSNSLRNVMSSGTASTISGSISANQITGLSPVAITGNYRSLIDAPTIVSAFNNDIGYVTASGTVAFSQNSGTASSLSGIIPMSQIQGNLDYSRIANLPANLAAIANSGTASNVALSGTTNIVGTTRLSGGVMVTGTYDNVSNTVIATGSNQILIPQQGDLSMGTFTAGAQPQ